MCLHCGFYSTDDPIQCPNDHCTVPCQDCQDNFAIFGEMNKLFEEVQERWGYNESQPWLQDDILFWGSQIKDFSQNLRDYRAHLADKVSEANFEHKDRDLGEGEALVVIDYKMKVLPRMFREKMKDWYSKRGISILGVTTILCSTWYTEWNFALSTKVIGCSHSAKGTKSTFVTFIPNLLACIVHILL